MIHGFTQQERNEIFLETYNELRFLKRLDNQNYPSTKQVQELEIKETEKCIIYDIIGLSDNTSIKDFGSRMIEVINLKPLK